MTAHCRIIAQTVTGKIQQARNTNKVGDGTINGR